MTKRNLVTNTFFLSQKNYLLPRKLDLHSFNIISCMLNIAISNDTKFQDEIFTGYDITGGRISHFPIDFCMSLTKVQRYRLAPSMISLITRHNV